MSDITLHALDSDEGLLVAKLLSLPHRILSNHEVHGLEQLVLHDLGHGHNFNLGKAGYFIDNPDFDCFKGVAGYDDGECSLHQQDPWASPQAFVESMSNAPFQKKIAGLAQRSVAGQHKTADDAGIFKTLGATIGMKDPSVITWKMKHGNNGVLLFESSHAGSARKQELLQHFLPLLGLC